MLFEYFERSNTLRMSESDEILDSSNPRVLTDNASEVVKLCSAATWREETAFAGKPGDVYTACAEGDNVYEVFQEMYGGVLKQIEGNPADTKRAPSFRGTYCIDVGDEKLYRKWDFYMHNQFALLYMDYKDKLYEY